MKHPRSLPAREPPLPGESLISLLRRTATAMGYDSIHRITRLLGATCRPHQNLNQMSPGLHLDRLALLLRLSPDALLQHTIHHFAAALVLGPASTPAPRLCDARTARRFFAARSAAICPCCLAEDQTPYERLVWSFHPLTVCTRHGCTLLARCPTCNRTLPPGRPDLLHCACRTALPGCRTAAISAPALACARTLEHWLGQDFRIIPALSRAAGFWLAERLAAAIGKTPRWLRSAADRLAIDPTAPPHLLHWTAAVEILASWPGRLYQFLDEFQRVVKNRARSTGVSRSFGSLLRDVSYLEGLGHPAPAEALRSYLLERYTAGHVTRKVGLFRDERCQRSLAERPWYTQTEAATVLQLRQGAVGELVRRGLLQGQVLPAGSRGRSMGIVSKNSVARLQRSLATGRDGRQASRELGIGRCQVFGLLRAGLLKNAVRARRGWVIPREAIQEIQDLCQVCPPLDLTHPHWLPLRQATRTYGPSGLNLPRALELVRTRRLAARTDRRHPNLKSLWLFRPDIEAQVPEWRSRRCRTQGYSLCQLGKILLPQHPSREPVLKKWMRAGLLRAWRQGRAWVVSWEEVERFRTNYCLAAEVCTILQVSRSTLSRWARSGRLKPVYGRRLFPGAGCSLYLRTDLSRTMRTVVDP